MIQKAYFNYQKEIELPNIKRTDREEGYLCKVEGVALEIFRVSKDLALNFLGSAILATFCIDPRIPAGEVIIVAFAFFSSILLTVSSEIDRADRRV